MATMVICRSVSDYGRFGEPIPADHELAHCSICSEAVAISPSGKQSLVGDAIITCTTCGYVLARFAKDGGGRVTVNMTDHGADYLSRHGDRHRVLSSFLDLTKDKTGGGNG